MDGNVYGFVFDFDERQKQIVTAATILKKEKLPHERWRSFATFKSSVSVLNLSSGGDLKRSQNVQDKSPDLENSPSLETVETGVCLVVWDPWPKASPLTPRMNRSLSTPVRSPRTRRALWPEEPKGENSMQSDPEEDGEAGLISSTNVKLILDSLKNQRDSREISTQFFRALSSAPVLYCRRASELDHEDLIRRVHQMQRLDQQPGSPIQQLPKPRRGEPLLDHEGSEMPRQARDSRDGASKDSTPSSIASSPSFGGPSVLGETNGNAQQTAFRDGREGEGFVGVGEGHEAANQREGGAALGDVHAEGNEDGFCEEIKSPQQTPRATQPGPIYRPGRCCTRGICLLLRGSLWLTLLAVAGLGVATVFAASGVFIQFVESERSAMQMLLEAQSLLRSQVRKSQEANSALSERYHQMAAERNFMAEQVVSLSLQNEALSQIKREIDRISRDPFGRALKAIELLDRRIDNLQENVHLFALASGLDKKDPSEDIFTEDLKLQQDLDDLQNDGPQESNTSGVPTEFRADNCKSTLWVQICYPSIRQKTKPSHAQPPSETTDRRKEEAVGRSGGGLYGFVGRLVMEVQKVLQASGSLLLGEKYLNLAQRLGLDQTNVPENTGKHESSVEASLPVLREQVDPVPMCFEYVLDDLTPPEVWVMQAQYQFAALQCSRSGAQFTVNIPSVAVAIGLLLPSDSDSSHHVVLKSSTDDLAAGFDCTIKFHVPQEGWKLR